MAKNDPFFDIFFIIIKVIIKLLKNGPVYLKIITKSITHVIIKKFIKG